MNEDDIIYGVGESNRGINKNIGMHRYGGIWTGDNKSWWSHILLNLKMMPSLNMCGFLYTGADLGGFGADTAREFLLRHLALGVFIPLMLGNEIMIALNEVPLFIRLICRHLPCLDLMRQSICCMTMMGFTRIMRMKERVGR